MYHVLALVFRAYPARFSICNFTDFLAIFNVVTSQQQLLLHSSHMYYIYIYIYNFLYERSCACIHDRRMTFAVWHFWYAICILEPQDTFATLFLDTFMQLFVQLYATLCDFLCNCLQQSLTGTNWMPSWVDKGLWLVPHQRLLQTDAAKVISFEIFWVIKCLDMMPSI